MVFKRLDTILQELIEDAEIDAGSEPMRASNEEGTRPTGGDSVDRMHPREQGGAPRMEKDEVKAPSRTRDGWTIRKPAKRTGTRAPAELVFGKFPPTIGRDMATARKRAEPHGSAVVISLAIWKSARGHARSFSGART